MKVKVNIEGAIVDMDVASQVLEILNGKAEWVRKDGWGEDAKQKFVEPHLQDFCISPMDMSLYAQAVMNRDSD
jgi:hypothetical protein